VDIILLYECTGNSLVGGPGFYRAIVDKIRETLESQLIAA
jgi:maleate cis-trans isomerase